jgi:hypothetical protein
MVHIEQKSAGMWSEAENDFKWQHIEPKHDWKALLLCGIAYTEVRFWMVSRAQFDALIAEKKITRQGNKEGDSFEGWWCKYLDVKDSLVRVHTDEDVLAYIEKECCSPQDSLLAPTPAPAPTLVPALAEEQL